MSQIKIPISGMHCASCSVNIQNSLNKLPGVNSVSVNYALNNATIDFDDKSINFEKIKNKIESIGYKVVDSSNKINKDAVEYKKRFLNSLIFGFPVIYLTMGIMSGLPNMGFTKNLSQYIQVVLTTFVLIISRKILISGIKGIMKLTPNMDSLILLGTVSAYIYSVASLLNNGKLFFESSVFIFIFINLGKYLESKTKGKTSDAIQKLMKLKPKEATIIIKGAEKKISLSEILIGDTLVVKPGESFPTDGIVVEGNSSVNQSMVTGEAMPVEISTGSNVIGGTINQNGTVLIQAVAVGENTLLSKIVRVVETAISEKSSTQVIADKISSIFVPFVIVIASISFGLWFYFTGNTELALTMFVSVLIIACPCALGLATPTALMMGVGLGAKSGILLKNSKALEAAKNIDTIVFDKTGTLTLGQPIVTKIVPFKHNETNILQIAASIEKKSEHPLANAIVEEAKVRKINLLPVKNFKSIPGQGVSAEIENNTYLIGNKNYIENNQVNISENQINMISDYENCNQTIIFICEKKELIGLVSISDTLKPDAQVLINKLKSMGMEIVLLTGDSVKVAKPIAETLGIKKVVAEVLPQDKASEIKKIQKEGHVTAMVGDGVNDAPALAQADLGIALGSGTDIAIETGDIIIIEKNLTTVVKAINLGNYTIRKIKQNFFWAFIYNVISIPIAAGAIYSVTGIALDPSIAAASMAFSSVSVVLNSLSMKNYKFN